MAFRKIDYAELLYAMKRADYYYFLPAILITLFQFYLRSVRWKYLVDPLKKVSVMSLLSAVSIGYMANNILPARIGEFVRAYALGNKEGVSISASFATVVVERILDMLTVFILMLAVLYLIQLPPEKAATEQMLKQGGGAAALIFFLFLIILFYFKKHRLFFMEFISKIIRPVSDRTAEKLCSFFDSFVGGLSILQNGKHLFPIVIYSFAVWLISSLPIYLILTSFGYQMPYSISIFILVLLAFAVAIPSAPGFIGTFHYACATGLEIFGATKEEALSVAIILHAINFLPITLVGFCFLWRSRISIKSAKKAEHMQEKSGAPGL